MGRSSRLTRPIATERRDELPSAATTSGAVNVRPSLAFTPVMRPVALRTGSVTVTPSTIVAPALRACSARSWSKSARGRTTVLGLHARDAACCVEDRLRDRDARDDRGAGLAGVLGEELVEVGAGTYA